MVAARSIQVFAEEEEGDAPAAAPAAPAAAAGEPYKISGDYKAGKIRQDIGREVAARHEPYVHQGVPDTRRANVDADVTSLLGKMKAATTVKRGEPGIKETVEGARDEMNRFVAYYRRNNKVAGAASFSTLYTAISTLSGHFQNYGPEYPVPAKRQKVITRPYFRPRLAVNGSCCCATARPL